MWNGVLRRTPDDRLFATRVACAPRRNSVDEDRKPKLDRRTFLKTAAASAGVAATPLVVAQSTTDAAAKAAAQSPAKKKEKPHPGDIVIERPGSDFMVDVIKTLDLEYIATNPASSF